MAEKKTKKVTTRRTRKKATKKVEDVGPKTLNDAELRQIEVSILEVKNSKLETGNQEQYLQNLLLELELLKHRILKAKEKVSKYDSEHKNRNDAYNVLIKNICDKYTINKAKFGYNPDTGEIITD